MPKVPRGEWGAHDPDHEEYNPSSRELEHEERVARDVRHEFADIMFTLRHPSEDPFTGARDQYAVADPIGLWGRLADLSREVAEIANSEFRRTLEAEITKVNREVYRQYVPFIESRIRWYAFVHSPLERAGRRSSSQSDEIRDWILHARDIGERLAGKTSDRVEFILELDRLGDMLDRYEREPTLFTFERIEEEVWTALEPYRDAGHGSDHLMIEDPEASNKEQMALERIAGKIFTMREIAERMLPSLLRSQCMVRVVSIGDAFERIRGQIDTPRELLQLEATLRDAIDQARLGHGITSADLAQWRKRWETLAVYDSRRKSSQEIVKLLNSAERLASGKSIDEDEERFNVSVFNEHGAATLLGVRDGATLAEIQQAYWRLGKKYHPDFSQTHESDAHTKMKLINDAYSVLRRKHVKLK